MRVQNVMQRQLEEFTQVSSSSSSIRVIALAIGFDSNTIDEGQTMVHGLFAFQNNIDKLQERFLKVSTIFHNTTRLNATVFSCKQRENEKFRCIKCSLKKFMLQTCNETNENLLR